MKNITFLGYKLFLLKKKPLLSKEKRIINLLLKLDSNYITHIEELFTFFILNKQFLKISSLPKC